ncbi:MAG: hypothetical protein JWM39_309 [Parcubacteria group bacterium]|nr:hypothetical protein [Parcubacteria group bacterium]
MMKHIVFITDCSDIAYSELRGTALSELAKLTAQDNISIEPVVSVKPFSILNGNFVLRLMAESYPEGTVFSVILNPSKNRPERLLGRTKKNNFLFVGANTGVFEWFLRDFGVAELYELKDPGFLPFGGKYVHAPAVAKLASGIPPAELGNPFQVSGLRKLEILPGTIVHVDNFGLMKFNTVLPKFEEGARLRITVKGLSIPAVYSTRMMNRETGEWVIYPGSSLGLPELGKVRQNGALELGVAEGDQIFIEIEK